MTSTPAPSSSAMASSTERSSMRLNSVSLSWPASCRSRASFKYDGRNRLPTTSLRNTSASLQTKFRGFNCERILSSHRIAPLSSLKPLRVSARNRLLPRESCKQVKFTPGMPPGTSNSYPPNPHDGICHEQVTCGDFSQFEHTELFFREPGGTALAKREYYVFSLRVMPARERKAMTPRIKTTVVGSYPVPSWLIGNTSRLVLRDAVMAVLKTQELAGIDLATDGELMRFDPSHPETNGMVDYFASRMDGIRKHFSLSDFDRFRADRASAYRLLTAGMVAGKIHDGTLNLPRDYEFVSSLTNLPLKFTCTGPHILARVLTNCY